MLCDELRLPVYNKMRQDRCAGSQQADCAPGVHFLRLSPDRGEPDFYAGRAFVLPKRFRGVGLVVK